MVFFWDEVRPELPEPPSLPLKLGEPVDVDLLDADALLVTTREIVLLPLTVSMVVVTTGAVSLVGAASLVGPAVVVVKAVWICTGVEEAAVDVGVSLVGVGVGSVEVSSSTVGVGVDDVGGAGEDGAREVVVTTEDGEADVDAGASDEVDSESDCVAELEGATDAETPVPMRVLES